jgi:hypothetical protein
MTAEQPTPPAEGTPPAAPPPPTPPASTPPAAAPAPSTTASATTGGGLPIGAGQIVAILGAVVVAVSTFLDWIDVSARGASITGSATDVPVQFLYDKNTDSVDPSLLVLLIPAAVLLLLGALIPKGKVFGILGGLLAIAVPVLYAVQVQRGLDDDLASTNIGLTDFIGIGVYVAFAGGVIGLVGAILSRTRPTPGAPPPLAA